MRYLHNPRAWSSAARNIGVENARGKIVVFIDGHVHIEGTQLLANTERLFKEKLVRILGRPQFLFTPGNTSFQNAVAYARASFLGHGRDSSIYSHKSDYVNPSSSGASYIRDLFSEIGGFNETFDASEDYEFNYRASKFGFKSYQSIELAVYYYPRKGIVSLFRQMERYGKGRMRLARMYPETLSLGTLAPACFLLGPMIALLFYLIYPLGSLAIASMYLIYFGLSLFIGLGAWPSYGWKTALLVPVVLPCIHMGLGTGFIFEFFSGKKSRTQKS